MSPKKKVSASKLLAEADFSSLEGRIVERVLEKLFSDQESELASYEPRPQSSKPGPRSSKPGPQSSKAGSQSSKPGPLSSKRGSKLHKPGPLSSKQGSLNKLIGEPAKILPPLPCSSEAPALDELISMLPNSSQDSLKNESTNIFKIPSKVGEVLISSTILSSPSISVERESNCSSDSSDNGILDTSILNLESNYLLPMKFHPKFRHFQTLINGELKPTLPRDVMSPNFFLPSVPKELHVRFCHSQEQLQKAIIIFSIAEELINNGFDNEERHLDRILKSSYSHSKTLMIREANNFGLTIRKIRRKLLENAYCKDANALPNFINAPLHVSQFFGGYVTNLQRRIHEEGPSFCIQVKSIAKLCVHQLPPRLELDKNPFDFLIKLNDHVNATEINEVDKIVLLRSLLPETLKKHMDNHCGQSADYKRLSSWILRCSNENSGFIKQRRAFTQRFQKENETPAQFGETLVAMKDKCLYGELGMELLRDQFIFGLSDDALKSFLMTEPFWTFQQCFEYATGGMKNSGISKDNKLDDLFDEFSLRRKNGVLEHSPKPEKVKKLKSSHLLEIPVQSPVSTSPITMDKPMLFSDMMYDAEKWNEKFNLDVPYSKDIFCPWTGVTLR